jgi:phage tail-like protein
MATSGGGSAQRSVPDPFMAFQFRVTVGTANGVSVAGGFSDVSGLGAETEVETLRVGGLNSAEVTLPGATKFSSRLVLKRGLADKARLWQWYQKVLAGEIARENVTIAMVTAEGSNGLSWTFSQACPVKWTGPELHASGSSVAFESIELVHKGFLPGA